MIRFILPFILLFITALPVCAQDKVLDIKTITSPGGIEAWLVEDHSVPVISLKFAFKGAGASQDPPGKQGLARMASNTMDEGAGDLTSEDFQKELLNYAISLRFSSGRDNFIGTLKTVTENKERAVKLMSLALKSPRFDAEPVDRMRKANQARIRSSLSDPNWIAARLMNDIAYGEHHYAQNSGGTLSSLEAITPEDLRSFAEKKLAKNNLKIGVSGDITAEELALLLDEIFGHLPEKATLNNPGDSQLQNSGKVVLFEKPIPQTIIQIIQPGIEKTDPEYFHAQIMNFTLGSSGFGSRLTEEIRAKRGLTYGIYSYFNHYDHSNSFGVRTSTKNENVGTMLSLIKSEIETLKADGLSDQELETAKSYLIGSLPLSLTSNDNIAGLLLSIQTEELGIDYLERRKQAIEDATLMDIQSVAKKVLDPDQFTTVLVGQPKDIQPSITIETLPNVE